MVIVLQMKMEHLFKVMRKCILNDNIMNKSKEIPKKYYSVELIKPAQYV